MTDAEKRELVKACMRREGFAKQAKWPELVAVVVKAAEELAERIAAGRKDAT